MIDDSTTPSAPRLSRLARRAAPGPSGGLGLVRRRGAAGPRREGGGPIVPPGGDPRPIPGGLRPGGEFDRFVRQQAEQDLFSGNVLLAFRGRPVLARSYGMADKALSIPNRLDTRFALASVTKAMTATAVVQRVERGALTF